MKEDKISIILGFMLLYILVVLICIFSFTKISKLEDAVGNSFNNSESTYIMMDYVYSATTSQIISYIKEEIATDGYVELNTGNNKTITLYSAPYCAYIGESS